MKKWVKQMGRRKILDDVINETTHLKKVLTTTDLTALGIGCTLGVGVYVLPGLVAREIAGPGVLISFLIAAIVSIFAGLCFAEFGARVPRAGSAYIYSYVTIGEFVAFTIGWSLIMEYIIGSASVARGLSLYIDSMTGNQMASFFRNIYELDEMEIFSEYFDLFALGITLIVTVCLMFGLKDSLLINNIFTLMNVSVVVFAIIAGSFHVNFGNWTLPKSSVPPRAGEGGFLPFGIMGAIKGASTCFYGYVGFDVIATTGEEVENPQKSIPLSIIISLAVTFIAYYGLSAVLTLMLPYYLQDIDAPIPHVFAVVGWDWAAWFVSIGGIFGLLASLCSGMYPLPRIIYSMANDGLMYRWLGYVSPKFGTPFIGTLVAGVLTGLMAATFKLKQLVDLMSIATLLAYGIVAACVLLLRYKDDQHSSSKDIISHEYIEHAHLLSKQIGFTWCSMFEQLFNPKGVMVPTKLTSAVAIMLTILFSVFSCILSYILVKYEVSLLQGNTLPSALSVILICLMALCTICLYRQPSDTSTLKFKVPCVPLIPCVAIFSNIYLMMLMDNDTWIRFLVWMMAGYIIYFGYGISNSSMRSDSGRRRIEYEVLKGDDKTESFI